uniref:branched-chain amino acid ABC transporter permease n=1 Tax=Roseiarcus sp. TaxID=1969460 RepID=UPI003F952D0F
METAPTTTWRIRKGTRVSSGFAVFAFAAVLVGFAAPLFASRGVVQDLFFILTMLVLAQSWNVLAGYAGLVSVGQQAFVGFGGYVMFACVLFAGLDPLLAVLIAGAAATALAALTGRFVFRLQGPHFAIGTWVVAEVARLTLAQWTALGGGTGTSLPASATREMLGAPMIGRLFGFRAAQSVDTLCYWLALALAVGTIGFIYPLLRSRQGLALAAVRDNQETARSVGVDARRVKTFVYLMAAFLTGLTGALIYVQKARISPDAAFSVLDWTADVIFIVVIGGIGT